MNHAPQITINSERPRGAPSCAKCAHLRTSEKVVSCAVGGPLTPCDLFKDASVDRTFRRSIKTTYAMLPRFA